ncbi:hypothetical protein [Clostridium saudiense]|uniref:hypothetical protein n=1 Tax=Clostridium saudiense TaxID=1414720 RepID=UPI001A9B35F5|nr:hypothetical protein [Clostridium saudiense]MDU3521760.1 hypothetical protein [Clostridium saudiense]
MLVTITAFIGTIIGSYSGFLFSQSQPDGLGYISMLTTIFLGIKFLVKPIEEGHDADSGSNDNYSSQEQDIIIKITQYWQMLNKITILAMD